MEASTENQATSNNPAVKPLVISAPFGNYVQPKGATATLGTFTLHERKGRVVQVLRTVRYYRRLGAWVNKIGLRNPGIDWLVARSKAGRTDVQDKIVSIHGFDAGQWSELLAKTATIKPMAIELNMSCPNVGEINFPDGLFDEAAACGCSIIVKLPPVNYQDLLHHALKAGLRDFHCFNTLPVPAGGLSGRPLKPIALQGIRDVRRLAGEAGVDDCELRIIGGGGIRLRTDIDEYKAAGADRFAIGTRCFNPLLLFSTSSLDFLVAHATQAARSID